MEKELKKELIAKLNKELVSVEVWDEATNDWQAYDCPKGKTVAEYAVWCIEEHSEYWAAINCPEDKIRLNGWYVIDGAEFFKAGKKMLYVNQLPKKQQIKIVIELVKKGLTNEEIDDALNSKIDDLVDTIDIKKLLENEGGKNENKYKY